MIAALYKARDLAHECAARLDAEGAYFWIAMQHRIEADMATHREIRQLRTHGEAELVSAE